jgi:hypothetical protein
VWFNFVNFILKYLVITALTSLILYAGDENQDLDGFENYKRLTSSIRCAKTYEGYADAIRAVCTFVEQHPEDMYSVDLLKSISFFFPVWNAAVNIPLFRKITGILNHPKLYEAHMVLYFYGDEEDKDEAMLSFSGIAHDKNHHRQEDAYEFLQAIKNSRR